MRHVWRILFNGPELAQLNSVNRSRQYRPGFGGVMQPTSQAGWHPIAHAGAVEGIVLADYQLTTQYSTQAGARQRLVQIFQNPNQGY